MRGRGGRGGRGGRASIVANQPFVETDDVAEHTPSVPGKVDGINPMFDDSDDGHLGEGKAGASDKFRAAAKAVSATTSLQSGAMRRRGKRESTAAVPAPFPADTTELEKELRIAYRILQPYNFSEKALEVMRNSMKGGFALLFSHAVFGTIIDAFRTEKTDEEYASAEKQASVTYAKIVGIIGAVGVGQLITLWTAASTAKNYTEGEDLFVKTTLRAWRTGKTAYYPDIINDSMASMSLPKHVDQKRMEKLLLSGETLTEEQLADVTALYVHQCHKKWGALPHALDFTLYFAAVLFTAVLRVGETVYEGGTFALAVGSAAAPALIKMGFASNLPNEATVKATLAHNAKLLAAYENSGEAVHAKALASVDPLSYTRLQHQALMTQYNAHPQDFTSGYKKLAEWGMRNVASKYLTPVVSTIKSAPATAASLGRRAWGYVTSPFRGFGSGSADDTVTQNPVSQHITARAAAANNDVVIPVPSDMSPSSSADTSPGRSSSDESVSIGTVGVSAGPHQVPPPPPPHHDNPTTRVGRVSLQHGSTRIVTVPTAAAHNAGV